MFKYKIKIIYNLLLGLFKNKNWILCLPFQAFSNAYCLFYLTFFTPDELILTFILPIKLSIFDISYLYRLIVGLVAVNFGFFAV